MKRGYLFWSASTIFMVMGALEAIYPSQSKERLIDIGPDYSPYIVASVSILIGLIAAWFAWQGKGEGYEVIKNTPDNSGRSTPTDGSGASINSDSGIVTRISNIINGIKLFSPSRPGKEATFKDDSSSDKTSSNRSSPTKQ